MEKDLEVSYHVSPCLSNCMMCSFLTALFVHSYLDIEASILDSINVQELEYLIKLNIQKGKAFSTLGQGKDGFNAFQSALDVSITYLQLLTI